MYHKIDPSRVDFLTVTTDRLRLHLTYLQQSGYQIIALSQLLDSITDPARKLPARAVLLTFDDAYENNLTHALPVLRDLQLPATMFVSTAYVGGCNEWDEGGDAILTADQLRCLTTQEITLAYHSHRHLNYKKENIERIRDDLATNVTEATRMNLPMAAAFSFPYGGRPKDPVLKRQVEEAMEKMGIQAAFRIGNRLNPLPLRNPYDLNRIDVRGTDSIAAFKRKVRWGKIG